MFWPERLVQVSVQSMISKVQSDRNDYTDVRFSRRFLYHWLTDHLVLGANGAIFLFIELFSFLLATWKVWQLTSEAKNKTDRPITRLNKLIMSQGTLLVVKSQGVL